MCRCDGHVPYSLMTFHNGKSPPDRPTVLSDRLHGGGLAVSLWTHKLRQHVNNRATICSSKCTIFPESCQIGRGKAGCRGGGGGNQTWIRQKLQFTGWKLGKSFPSSSPLCQVNALRSWNPADPLFYIFYSIFILNPVES